MAKEEDQEGSCYVLTYVKVLTPEPPDVAVFKDEAVTEVTQAGLAPLWLVSL